MAFDSKKLRLVGSENFVNKYSYVTNDSLVTVGGSGYFNSIAASLKKGDLIDVSAANSGTPACQMFVVSSADAATTVTTVGAANITVTSAQVFAIEVGFTGLATAETRYIAVPVTSTVTSFYGTSDGNGATATGTFTVTRVAGSSAIGTVTFASSYSAGALRTGTVSASPALTGGTDVIKIVNDAGNAGTGKATIVFVLTPS